MRFQSVLNTLWLSIKQPDIEMIKQHFRNVLSATKCSSLYSWVVHPVMMCFHFDKHSDTLRHPTINANNQFWDVTEWKLTRVQSWALEHFNWFEQVSGCLPKMERKQSSMSVFKLAAVMWQQAHLTPTYPLWVKSVLNLQIQDVLLAKTDIPHGARGTFCSSSNYDTMTEESSFFL